RPNCCSWFKYKISGLTIAGLPTAGPDGVGAAAADGVGAGAADGVGAAADGVDAGVGVGGAALWRFTARHDQVRPPTIAATSAAQARIMAVVFPVSVHDRCSAFSAS